MASAAPTYEFRWYVSGATFTTGLTTIATTTTKIITTEYPIFSKQSVHSSEQAEFTAENHFTGNALHPRKLDVTSARNNHFETTNYRLENVSVSIEAASHIAFEAVYGLTAAIIICLVLLVLCVVGAAIVPCRNRRTLLQSIRARTDSICSADNNPRPTDNRDRPSRQPEHLVSLHSTRVANDANGTVGSHNELGVVGENSVEITREGEGRNSIVQEGLQRNEYEEIEHLFDCNETGSGVISSTQIDGRRTPTLPSERKYLSLKAYACVGLGHESVSCPPKSKGYSFWKNTLRATSSTSSLTNVGLSPETEPKCLIGFTSFKGLPTVDLTCSVPLEMPPITLDMDALD